METTYTVEFRNLTGSCPIKLTLPDDNYAILQNVLGCLSKEGDTLKVQAKTGRSAEYRHFYNHGNGKLELSAVTLG